LQCLRQNLEWVCSVTAPKKSSSRWRKNTNTTHLYVEADLKMKRQALEVLVPPKSKKPAKPQQDPLIRILESL